MRKEVFAALERKKQYKYPYLLLGLYLTFLLSTVCLASRITQVGSMLEPGGIFVFPLTFSICDIVGEVYGYAYPRLFIWIGVLAEFLFLWLLLQYPIFLHLSFLRKLQLIKSFLIPH
ncbi:VUT family protein [Legionella pneumophila]|nr:VUT family protein [Legionella pneumophila]